MVPVEDVAPVEDELLAAPPWPPVPELLDELPPVPLAALPEDPLGPQPRHGSKPLPSSRHVCAPVVPPAQAQATCCPGTQSGSPPLDVLLVLVVVLVPVPVSTPPPQLAVATTRAPTPIQAFLIGGAYSRSAASEKGFALLLLGSGNLRYCHPRCGASLYASGALKIICNTITIFLGLAEAC